MAPLIVLVLGWVAFRAAGAFGFDPADSTVGALRFALAVMFAFTAVSHFAPRTRADLIRMVPSQLPAPAALVTLTGILEVAGAVGLLVPGLVRPAAFALAALLVAFVPANVRAARSEVGMGERSASALAWRLPLQAFWVAALIAVGLVGAPAV